MKSFRYVDTVINGTKVRNPHGLFVRAPHDKLIRDDLEEEFTDTIFTLVGAKIPLVDEYNQFLTDIDAVGIDPESNYVQTYEYKSMLTEDLLEEAFERLKKVKENADKLQKDNPHLQYIRDDLPYLDERDITIVYSGRFGNLPRNETAGKNKKSVEDFSINDLETVYKFEIPQDCFDEVYDELKERERGDWIPYLQNRDMFFHKT